MPFDGSGNFTRVHSWQQDRDNGIRIVADRHDQEDDNFAQGFNQTFLRNGVVPMSGALNMNGNPIRGVAGGSAAQPTMTSVLDPLSGYFSPAPAQLGVSIAGVQRGLWTAAGLAVSGAITATGDVTVGGNLVFTGNLSVPGTLSVTGASTFTGKTTHSGGIEATTGAFSGALTAASLTTTGNIIGNNFGIGGGATIAGTLGVTGISTFTDRTIHNGGISSVSGAFSGPVTGTSLGLSGGLTAASINVSGQTTLSGPVNVTGAVTLLNLSVTGAASFGSTVSAVGDLTVTKDLYAKNTIALTSSIAPVFIGTNAIGLRIQNNDGAIAFTNGDASVQTGFVNNLATGMTVMNQRAGGPLLLGTAGGTRVTITAAGTVGIGNSAPQKMLDVYQNVGIGGDVSLRLGSVAENFDQFSARLSFVLGDGGVPFTHLYGPVDANGALVFFTGNPSTERMRITAAGVVEAKGPVNATVYRIGGAPRLGVSGASTFIQGGAAGTIIVRENGTSAISIDSNGLMLLQNTGVDQKLVMRAAQPLMTFQNAAGDAVLATMQAAANEFQFACAKPILFFVGGTQVASMGANGNLIIGGAITAAGDITAFSDERFKTNVRRARGLEAVCEMEGVTFEHISSKRKSAGVIAQELIKVAPELVHMDDRGHYSVNYGGLAAYFIEAIKDLNAKVSNRGYTG